MVWWTFTWVKFCLEGVLDLFLPGNGRHHPCGRDDLHGGGWRVIWWVLGGKEYRVSTCSRILVCHPLSGCRLSSCSRSRWGKDALPPPASGATLPERVWWREAPDSPHRSSSRPMTGGGRKRHKGEACHLLHAVTGLPPPLFQKHLPQPRTV